ncbi:MAG: cyclic nucleotide-binding domain-containing protein [bacterium]|nr:cyclic nucleotide-binding domain-containing protein [bacterium]MCP5070699.1 cyclic nucleotide-binding domain-containing protein [bacterium]
MAPASDELFGSRGDPRIGTDLPARLYSTGFSGPLVARTRDLSTGGACVATESPIDAKSIQRIEIQVDGRWLGLDAEGRWQDVLRGDDVVMTGVEFVNPTNEAVDMLWDVVLEGGKQLARFLYVGSDLRPMGVDGAMGLSQITRTRKLPAGHTVYRQDFDPDASGSIFVVESGSVILQVRARGVREIPIDRVVAGQVFGGLSMLAGVPPTESAITESETTLLEFDARGYQYLARNRPWLAQELSHIVTTAYVRRLHRVLEKVRDDL